MFFEALVIVIQSYCSIVHHLNKKKSGLHKTKGFVAIYKFQLRQYLKFKYSIFEWFIGAP